jgi:hypothetical protein
MEVAFRAMNAARRRFVILGTDVSFTEWTW